MSTVCLDRKSKSIDHGNNATHFINGEPMIKNKTTIYYMY